MATNNFVTKIKTNLNGVLQMTQMIDGIMMTGDDKANEIDVYLHRDHVPYVIPSGSKIIGYFIRADGATLELEGTINSEGNAVVIIPALAYQVPGALSIAIRMLTGPYDEQQRGYYDGETGYFVIEDDPNVTEGPHGELIFTRTAHLWENKTVIASASCYVQMTETTSIIEPGHVIPDINDVIAKIEELDHSESLRREAEGLRVNAESSRVSAESARVAAENARVSAESARVTAENARVSAESTRNSNETTRQSNEATRQSNETTRQQNEGLRQSNETTRQDNEATRQSNETARQNAIQNMSVSAVPRAYDQSPTATISDVSGHKHIEFGLVQGHPFVIKKSFASVAAMEAYTGTDVVVYDFVIIASTVEDPDNSKLYMKNASNGWTFITDLSGAAGIQGPQGIQGIQGVKGETGDTGNGVASALVDNEYRLNLGFTNGATYQSGSIRGPQGEQGIQGNTGLPGAGLQMNYDIDTGAIVINVSTAVSGNGVGF